MPLTKDGIKHRTEIRIKCDERSDSNYHKNRSKREKIVKTPHEVGKNII